MTSITDVYRETPGEDARTTWFNYIEDRYGFFIVAGPKNVGKTIFLKRIAAEAASMMRLTSRQVVSLRFGTQGEENFVNPLWVKNPPSRGEESEQEYNRLVIAWIEKVVEDVDKLNPAMVIIDELDVSHKAVFTLAATLYLRNRIIFTSATVDGSEYVIPNLTERLIEHDATDRPYWDLHRRKVVSPIDYAYCSLTFEQDSAQNRTVEGHTIYGHDHLGLPLDLFAKQG